MKTFVLGLIFLGFTNLLHAQNDLAYVKVDIEEPVMSSNNYLVNSKYYDAFDNKIASGHVREFQKVVAKYDIKRSDIYSSNSKSNYTVVFEEGENKIQAEYDQDGRIVKCTELFKDIRLPYAISSDISKQYPGWAFDAVECNITYDNNNNQQVIYKVEIQKGNKKKSLKVNTSDYKL